MIAPHQAALRVVVRMSFDPVFAEAVRSAPSQALAGLGLSPREVGWLLAVDPRAWRHDPQKRRRTLHALVGELKASSAIALAETRRIAFLEDFFASTWFHRAVQERTSLAAAFAGYLAGAGLRTPQLGEVVRLEAQLAAARRELAQAGGPDWKAPPVPPGGPRQVTRAPGVATGRFSPDALQAVQAVERFLFDCSLMPIVVLADDAPRLRLPPPSGVDPVALGFVPVQAGISLVELDEATFAALERAAGPRVPVEQVGPLAAELVEDEVLIAVP
jgi:hypothetical protein